MMDPAYVYRAEVLDVHDGDTLRLRVDLGFRCAVTIQCRLHGVNCPELNTPEGKAAQAFVDALLTPPVVVIESFKDQRSFERWVCDVWLQDGRSLAQVLLDSGHAVVMKARPTAPTTATDNRTMTNLEDAIILGDQDQGALTGEHAHDLQNAVNLGILYVCPINDGTCPNGRHKGGPFLHFVAGKTQNDYDRITWPISDADSI